METLKTASAKRSLLKLAYAQPDEKKRQHRKEPLPGILFDATVVGLFIVLGIANLL